VVVVVKKNRSLGFGEEQLPFRKPAWKLADEKGMKVYRLPAPTSAGLLRSELRHAWVGTFLFQAAIRRVVKVEALQVRAMRKVQGALDEESALGLWARARGDKVLARKERHKVLTTRLMSERDEHFRFTGLFALKKLARRLAAARKKGAKKAKGAKGGGKEGLMAGMSNYFTEEAQAERKKKKKRQAALQKSLKLKKKEGG
jgi:hypothetical protein